MGRRFIAGERNHEKSSKVRDRFGHSMPCFFLLGIYLETPLSHRLDEHPSKPHLYWLWVDLFPGVLVAISACIHAVKKGYIALGFLVICAGIVLYLTAVSHLSLISISRGFLALAVILVAVINVTQSRKPFL